MLSPNLATLVERRIKNKGLDVRMETIDWMTVLPGGLAIIIFLGGMLMMFTNVWTTKDK